MPDNETLATALLERRAHREQAAKPAAFHIHMDGYVRSWLVWPTSWRHMQDCCWSSQRSDAVSLTEEQARAMAKELRRVVRPDVTISLVGSREVVPS